FAICNFFNDVEIPSRIHLWNQNLRGMTCRFYDCTCWDRPYILQLQQPRLYAHASSHLHSFDATSRFTTVSDHNNLRVARHDGIKHRNLVSFVSNLSRNAIVQVLIQFGGPSDSPGFVMWIVRVQHLVLVTEL